MVSHRRSCRRRRLRILRDAKLLKCSSKMLQSRPAAHGFAGPKSAISAAGARPWTGGATLGLNRASSPCIGASPGKLEPVRAFPLAQDKSPHRPRWRGSRRYPLNHWESGRAALGVLGALGGSRDVDRYGFRASACTALVAVRCLRGYGSCDSAFRRAFCGDSVLLRRCAALRVWDGNSRGRPVDEQRVRPDPRGVVRRDDRLARGSRSRAGEVGRPESRDGGYLDLADDISATNPLDTLIIEVTVQDSSPQRAQAVAAAIGDVYDSVVGEHREPGQTGAEPRPYHRRQPCRLANQARQP